MRHDCRRDYFVNDENKKLTPLEPISPQSESGLPSSDRSLERVLGAIDKTIKSFESVVKMVHDEVTSQGKLNMARHEMAVKLLGKMRLELAVLTDQLRDLLTSNNIQLGATVEARDALVRTREKLEEAAKDMSGQHELIRAEDEKGDAPRAVRVFVVRLTNFVWPVAVRGGKAALLWGVKLLAGSAALGGIAKIVLDSLTGAK